MFYIVLTIIIAGSFAWFIASYTWLIYVVMALLVLMTFVGLFGDKLIAWDFNRKLKKVLNKQKLS